MVEEIDLSRRLYLKGSSGTVETTVAFKIVDFQGVVVTAKRRGHLVEECFECTLQVAKDMYVKFLEAGYRQSVFVLDIPIE